MSYYLQIDEREPVSLASLTGWGDVRRWAEKMPHKDAISIQHLCEYGWQDNFVLLKLQLAALLKSDPPKDAQVKATLTNLLAELTAAKSAVVVSVTDGFGKSAEDT